MRTQFYPEYLKGRDHSKELGADGQMLNWSLEKLCGEVWAGFGLL